MRIWSLDELRSANLDPPTPIVEDLIAEGECIALIGKPKAGKSRMVLQLALSVSRGETFLGHAVPTPRTVLIFDLENRAHRVRHRLAKMANASAADERMHICAPDTLCDVETLCTANGVKALAQLASDVKPDLLIIDNWRLMLGGDENKTEVVVRGLRALSSLRKLSPKLAIVVVHHTRKSQGPDPPLLRIDASAWVENASGHSAFVAHLDACFGIEREIDRKSHDELVVFGGVSRSSVARTLLLSEDPETLRFNTAEDEDVVQKLLTDKELSAWVAVRDLQKFTFSDAVQRAATKNRKMVASMLRKLTSMNVLRKDSTGYIPIRSGHGTDGT